MPQFADNRKLRISILAGQDKLNELFEIITLVYNVRSLEEKKRFDLPNLRIEHLLPNYGEKAERVVAPRLGI